MTQKEALLYAQLKTYKFSVMQTKNFIGWALRNVKNPYVACSFGKDSAVMLHLILSKSPNIVVRFVRWKNETEYLDNYDEVIEQWKEKYAINLECLELSRTSLDDKVLERKTMFTSEFDSYFIGLRKDESVARRITLKKMGKFCEIAYNNKIRISPIADWSEKDIVAYIHEHNLPTLNSYLKHGFSTRTSSRVPREDNGIRTASLSALKSRDINSFNLLAQKFPEVNLYV